ncbi:hypothetical protein T440DRAFT_542341 [Plenodomus tracheiphilus IPT5]|uniref:Carbohydrate-binding module family 48 protein n=1 Tax=Plenodomus tracheiphilus IPT5 TaxID=1408161 RepID=A0A6A7BKX3_9PLEO|nr:hypothetical protein T440DRAFT_542341 [Plenodomus tracheiphilus IPT5]
MLSTLFPLLAFSTSFIQAALLPREEARIAAEALSKYIQNVYITEYSTIYAQPYPTATPPLPPTSVQNLTRTSTVVVTTTLHATGRSSNSDYGAPPGLRSGRLKPSSLISTSDFNWPTPSSYLQYGPGFPSPTPSGFLDPSGLPRFTYDPLPQSSVHVVPPGNSLEGRTTLEPTTPPGVAVPAPSTTVAPYEPVRTTAIVVVPVHPSTTAIVVVPTRPPGVARGNVMGPGLIPAAGQDGVMGHLHRNSQSEVQDAIETMIPIGVARIIPRAGPVGIDTTIEHETWESHKHVSHNINEGEFGAIIPVRLPSKDEEDQTDNFPVRQSTPTPTDTDNDIEDITSTSETTITVTKTLKRSSSSPSATTTAIPTPSSTTHSTASLPSPTTKDVHTSILTPDPRCPYPYPGVYCGTPKTTLITITKAPVKSKSSAASASTTAPPSSSSSSSEEDKKKQGKEKKTSKSWCPYPGQEC